MKTRKAAIAALIVVALLAAPIASIALAEPPGVYMIISDAESLRALLYAELQTSMNSTAASILAQGDAYLNQSKRLAEISPRLAVRMAVMAINTYSKALKALKPDPMYNATPAHNYTAMLLAKRARMLVMILAEHNKTMPAKTNATPAMLANMSLQLKNMGLMLAAQKAGIKLNSTAPPTFSELCHLLHSFKHAGQGAGHPKAPGTEEKHGHKGMGK